MTNSFMDNVYNGTEDRNIRQETNCIMKSHIFLEVVQTELIRFGEEFGSVHPTHVQYDVCSFLHFVALDDIIIQRPPHGEVHDRMEPERLVDKTLQNV